MTIGSIQARANPQGGAAIRCSKPRHPDTANLNNLGVLLQITCGQEPNIELKKGSWIPLGLKRTGSERPVPCNFRDIYGSFRPARLPVEKQTNLNPYCQ
jgi:hypothetical protein